MTVVELTDVEAKLFIEFRKRQSFLEMIESVGGFDVKNGSITVSFDNLGAVGSIKVEKFYRPASMNFVNEK